MIIGNVYWRRNILFFPGDGFIHETYVNAVGSYKKLPECAKVYPKGGEVEINIVVEVKAQE